MHKGSNTSTAIDYRLPANWKPILYQLTLKPFIGPFYGNKSFTFEGHVNIGIACQLATNRVVLHSRDLVIKTAVLHELDGDTNAIQRRLSSFSGSSMLSTSSRAQYPSQSVELEIEREFLTLTFGHMCAPSRAYMLEIVFEGVLRETMFGFYRSSYKDANQTTK